MRTLSAMSVLVFSLTLLGTPAPVEAKGRIRAAIQSLNQSWQERRARKATQPKTERFVALKAGINAFKDNSKTVQRFRAWKDRSKVVGAWRSFGAKHPTAKKWVKRGAIGVGVVAAVAAAPYVLGAAGTVLSGSGTVLSTIGGSGVVQGASALAGKAIAGGAGVALAGGKAAVGFAVHNAVPLVAGAGGAALYGRYKARKAVAAAQTARPLPPPSGQPVQMALPGIGAGL